MEEIGCKCQILFISLLSSRRKQTRVLYIYIFYLFIYLFIYLSIYLFIFPPYLYKYKKEVSLKVLCCHNDTWFHVDLTFLKPWANQCIFLTEMFVFSYVFTLDSVFKSLCLKAQNLVNKVVCYTHTLFS